MTAAADWANKAWQTVPLGDIADIKLGQMLDHAKHTTGRRLPYLRNVNVRWGTIEIDDLLEMYFEDDQLDRFAVKDDDVLVCEGGEPGRAAVWRGGPTDLKFQKALHRVRFRVPFEPRLLVYLLELLAKSGGLERRFTGSTIKHFTREAFLRLPVPLLPLSEQQRIVAEIEKQFTRLDEGIALLARSEANLKRYRGALFAAACEGRLVKSEAQNVEREIQDEDTEGYLNQAQTLVRVPKGWRWTTLDAIANVKGGITKDQKRRHSAPVRSVPYLRVANVQRGYLDLTEVKEIAATESEISDLALRPGDILFNEGGDRDKLGRGWVWSGEIEQCIHQNHVFRARLQTGIANSKFVSWYANTFGQAFFFSEGKHTTNLASISMSKLKRLPIPLPPLDEQQRIVAEAERRLSVIDEMGAVVEANLQRAKNLRQSILQRAFSGKL